MIIPKQFLKTIKRTGLGVHLFDEMRYDDNGQPIESFILNQEPYNKAEILVSGENFGCGSSREHAPWSLLDFGIRCIVAPSFADIFFNNCFKNGILPIVLEKDLVEKLQEYSTNPQARLSIDLEAQTISGDHLDVINFDVDPFRKHCLLNGLDDIGMTMEKSEHIDTYETKRKTQTPWLFVA
jgi:3-isopropylmalate/(R)-2-methylmalate dehydratase small subunit